MRNALVALACASRSLTNAVVHDAALLTPLRDPEQFRAEVTTPELRARLSAAFENSNDGVATLRRWKRRELLRIAARDLLGVADLPAVGRELAALADVSLDGALELADPRERVAVIGMGKLGGRELNYASDVDVLFVHEPAGSDRGEREADRVARAVLSAMSNPTPDGIVFRTDARLRPEGRAGALSRPPEGYRAYYERWGQAWEFQALLKSRPVAGDAPLGREFVELVQPFVWPEVLDADIVREVREMKARSEAEAGRRRGAEREVKRGPGGIRDVEFAVQLLQLVHGRQDPTIRSRTTLEALQQLVGGGYVENADAEQLATAYVFLRDVEHRLQLRDETQTHTVPIDPAARTLLARVLGYRDRPHAGALEAFDADMVAHQTAVRSIHERLFFAPLLDALTGVGRLPEEAVEERLRAFGFVDAEHTRRALHELQHGFRRTSRVMHELLPVVLDWLSATPDPDLGLLQLRRLTEGPTRATALAATFRDTPAAAARACRVLGSSRIVGDALLRQPEVVLDLADDAFLAPRSRDELVAVASETLAWRRDSAARRAGLRRFARREWLRIALRDVLGTATIHEVEREHTALAEACIEAALGALEPEVAFTVIGMGRLGGAELSYASDLDVMFLYDGRSAADFEAAERVATQLVQELGSTTGEGLHFEVDLRLRPEGKHGMLARSLDGYRAYYEQWAQPWERQALLRARVVAGDAELGGRFVSLIEPFVFRDPFPEEDAREIRRVKARIERERMPPGEDPEFHLKLGRGGLTDVEFTVQLLQLVHGAAHPEVRDASTTRGLERLAAAGLLERDDADVLLAAYRLCERARNAAFLVTGRPNDALPAGPEGVRVARLLGYLHRPLAELREDYRRVTRRARRVVDHIFYGRE